MYPSPSEYQLFESHVCPLLCSWTQSGAQLRAGACSLVGDGMGPSELGKMRNSVETAASAHKDSGEICKGG